MFCNKCGEMRYILFFHIFYFLSVVSASGALQDTVSVAAAGHGGAAVMPDSLAARKSAPAISVADSLARQADRYMLDYEFLKAISLYRQALESEQDSVKRIALENRKLQGENGASMMGYVYNPTVVASHRFSTEDFFLYYPMRDSSWRRVPNALDSLSGHPFAKAVYVPDGSREVYFSAPDEDGVRNIWHTEDRDTVWSLPALLNEQVTSSGDEVYPLLSSDGTRMYFSSDGLYGVGGYDLYVSEWDERNNDWGVPVNMGFPYSSPYDDLLFYNTPDGKYTMFASNRGCPPDSINVYVLEYDSMPIHASVADVEALREIMSLEPDRIDDGDVEGKAGADMPENPEVRKYMQKMKEVKSLRDTIYAYGIAVDELRGRYAASDDADEKEMLAGEIGRRESAIPALNDSLKNATSALQAIEMEFLFNGVVIDLDKVNAEADREIVPKDINYTFVKMEMGDSLVMDIEKPEPEFDYTFMVLPEGRFALDNTLPEGIVYQIQIFSLTHPASIRDIKGLSPVFLHSPSNGRYTYAVGLFRSYADALSQLNKVRGRGFKGAYIVAFKDGQPINVNIARRQEN